jgi:GNAT superfamily N-acetyltransferase
MKILAAKRLLAQEIHNETIMSSDGTRLCKQKTKEIAKQPHHWESLGIKDGLELGVFDKTSEYTMVALLDTEKTCVGYLELQDAPYDGLNIKYRIRSLFLLPEYRGKKLGTVLYLGGLHAFKHLVSDTSMSIHAVRTWKSLEKFGYKVRLFNTTLQQKVNFSWGSDGIPEVNNTSIEKIKDEFVLYI